MSHPETPTKTDTRTVLPLAPFDARLIDYSQVKVVPLLDNDVTPQDPPPDNRTILILDTTQAVLVDTSKVRVVAAQE